MQTIRCPKCRLINNQDAPRCRRCGTLLSSVTQEGGTGSRSSNSNRAARKWIIPAIAVTLLLGVFGYYRYSKIAPNYTGVSAEINRPTVKKHPADQKLEELKALSRDFLSSLDQNMSDRSGEGYQKNQPLAFDTMMALQVEKSKPMDVAAQKYLDEFYRLVNQYYDQLVRFNSEKADLAKASQKTFSEIEQIQQDTSLSDEEKYSRKRDLKREYFDKSQEYSVSSMDIDETVKSLRDLLTSGAPT